LAVNCRGGSHPSPPKFVCPSLYLSIALVPFLLLSCLPYCVTRLSLHSTHHFVQAQQVIPNLLRREGSTWKWIGSPIPNSIHLKQPCSIGCCNSKPSEVSAKPNAQIPRPEPETKNVAPIITSVRQQTRMDLGTIPASCLWI
jgi:hypothetical protein